MLPKSITKEGTELGRLAFSVEDISEMTTLSQAFVRNEIRANRLKATKCGRRVLILKTDLENYFLNQGGEND